MKKTVLFLFGFFFFFNLTAQDIIIKRNAERLEVNIIEVTSREVRYKMWGDEYGASHTLILGYVHKIIHENGSEEEYAPMYKDADRNYTKRKEPGLAALFSILYSGAGQLYNGDIGKAVIMGGINTVGIISLVSTVSSGGGSSGFGDILILLPDAWVF